MVLERYHLWGMWDPGDLFTLIARPLAQELGLQWRLVASHFQVISGGRLQMLGVIKGASIRLHKKVALNVREIKVVESMQMNLVLGQNLINCIAKDGLWCTKGSTTDNGLASI